MDNQYQGTGQSQNPNQHQSYTVVRNQSVVSIGDWIITHILMMIPVVGFIMLFVWAFGGGTPESKANWAKAVLIVQLIAIILVICFYGTIFAIVASAVALGR